MGRGLNKRGDPPASRPGDPQARALDIVRRLRGLARLLGEGTGAFSESAATLEVVMRVSADPKLDQKTAGELLASLSDALHVTARSRVPAGAVRCFRCESALCGHSRPSEPLQIFAGYDPMGRPRWVDLLSWCLDRRDERAEALLAGGGRVVAVVEPGSALRREQLPSFGGSDPGYRILGQVVAGPFPTRDLGPVAATFQVVRDGRPGRLARIRLDVLCFKEDLEREEPALGDILREGRATLDLLALRLVGEARSGENGDHEQAVLPFLRALARDLESHARGTLRRTGHALSRVRESVRPTEMAFPDARTVPDERILADTQESTLIVLGPHGRAHVFTRDGRHITSLRMRGDAIIGRRRSGRWRPAEAEERGDLRQALRMLSRGGGAGPTAGVLPRSGVTGPGS